MNGHPSLSTDSMIEVIKKKTMSIPAVSKNRSVPLSDTIMSGFAMFSLKCESLLAFDKIRQKHEHQLKNICQVYQIGQPPSDTYMREQLDEVEPESISKIQKVVVAKIQRSKQLEQYRYIGNRYLCAMDGTGYFSSKNVRCENCLVKVNKKTKEETYQHQMLSAVIVHPAIKQVIPLRTEPIIKQDGNTKNDCERNAAKRLLPELKREHPHLKLTIIEDGLGSNAPHIRDLQKHNFGFILGAKPKDHTYLFEMAHLDPHKRYLKTTTEDGFIHEFTWSNDMPINEANEDLRVNFLLYRQTDKKGKEINFSWVTDIELTENNVYQVMRAGRARWRIENETFHTLKNQGYQFEHNFGHGYKNLSTNFALLMMLAFTVDQAAELACRLYKAARERIGTKREFFIKTRVYFESPFLIIKSFTALLNLIVYPDKVPKVDTS